MNVAFDTTLNAGTYYFVLSGNGNTNTDYGSLGSYTITGFRGPLPIHDIALTGNVNKNIHTLNWNVVADEPIRSQEVQASTDGIVFNTIGEVTPSQYTFSYTPTSQGTMYYRMRLTSVIDQVAYSNIIALRSNANASKPFIVSTFVNNNIVITAPGNYDYMLVDANGRLIGKGKGVTGINRINVDNLSSGMYIIQLITNNEKQTERIIKQ
jgi:hypothetical protein